MEPCIGLPAGHGTCLRFSLPLCPSLLLLCALSLKKKKNSPQLARDINTLYPSDFQNHLVYITQGQAEEAWGLGVQEGGGHPQVLCLLQFLLKHKDVLVSELVQYLFHG